MPSIHWRAATRWRVLPDWSGRSQCGVRPARQKHRSLEADSRGAPTRIHVVRRRVCPADFQFDPDPLVGRRVSEHEIGLRLIAEHPAFGVRNDSDLPRGDPSRRADVPPTAAARPLAMKNFIVVKKWVCQRRTFCPDAAPDGKKTVQKIEAPISSNT